MFLYKLYLKKNNNMICRIDIRNTYNVVSEEEHEKQDWQHVDLKVVCYDHE